MPESVQVVRGIARRETFQVGVQREAGAELDAAGAQAGVEAVERPHRRAADDLALEVVDAAVAIPPAAIAVPVMKPRRVTVSPSKAPAMRRVVV